ncbi:hypothetical protein QVA66_05940 [Staphylococcus chromogenes]|nr:hypothetical protein [Staphylococcus chromogenes]
MGKVFAAIMIIVALIAVPFAFTEFLETGDGAPLFWAIGISIFIVWSLWSYRKQKRRETRVSRWVDGQVGVGRLQSWRRVGQDGARTYSLVMDIEGETGERFQGQITVPIGRRRLDGLYVGMLIPVVYRPQYKLDLALPSYHYSKPAQFFYDYICLRDGLVDQQTLNADYWGVPAKARMIRVTPTGRYQGPAQEFQFQLAVYPTDRAPFEATARKFVTPYEQRLFQVSPELDVKYVPQSPGVVVLRTPAHSKQLGKGVGK